MYSMTNTMDIIMLTFIGFAFLLGCTQPEAMVGNIPEDHQVIFGIDWVPTKADTASALKAIFRYVGSYNEIRDSFWKEEIAKLKLQFPEYYVQIYGRVKNGKRIIHCNFFFREREQDFPNWKKETVLVRDGGVYFWRIDYDIETGKCMNFETNGYA